MLFRKKCAIPGLEGRKLDFLGLMNCPYEASRREDLPAEKVSNREKDERTFICSLNICVYVNSPVYINPSRPQFRAV